VGEKHRRDGLVAGIGGREAVEDAAPTVEEEASSPSLVALVVGIAAFPVVGDGVRLDEEARLDTFGRRHRAPGTEEGDAHTGRSAGVPKGVLVGSKLDYVSHQTIFMNSGTNGGKPDRSRPVRSRRAFLASASLAALTGCTFNVNVGGDGGTGQSTTAPQTPRQTATTTPTATATPTDTPTATPTATPTPTPEAEYVVVTAEPEPRYVVADVVTPTPGPLRYRLENFHLYVVSANDGVFDSPDTEELYGSIDVYGNDGSADVEPTAGLREIWDRSSNDYVEIGEGNGRSLTPVFDPVVEFPAGVDREAAYIAIEPSLYEADKGANSDDTLENWAPNTRWFLNQEPTQSGYSRDTGESWFRIDMDDGGTHVRLSFDIVQL
jgi:hypothetical protein